jgi:nicotinamide riboside kinase
MRIYFVGSHATGKTTMTRHVSRKYDLPMVSEVARGVLAELEIDFEKLRSDIAMVNMYQEKVFARQMEVERRHNGSFVSDRAFDNLAYAAEHSTAVADIMATQEFRDYMAWVRAGTVFFLRPHRSLLSDDGTRERSDWESTVRIDGMVKFMLEQHRVSYMPIHTPSMQERVRVVEFVLGDPKAFRKRLDDEAGATQTVLAFAAK